MVQPVPEFTDAAWFKSSHSGSNQGNCVEVAFVGDHVGVRDSKQRGAGHILIFTAAEWAAFLADLRERSP